MSFCHQAPFGAVDSSVFVFLPLNIQPQRIAFLPGDKSTRVQVWLLIKLESSSCIESIRASDLLTSANPWGSLFLSRVFVSVAARPSPWSWSILAWVRSAVDRFALGLWDESRDSSSLAGVRSKELDRVGSSSRQGRDSGFLLYRKTCYQTPSQFLIHTQLCSSLGRSFDGWRA